MTRRKSASRKRGRTHSWGEIIEYAETKLRRHMAVATQIEAIIAYCKSAEEAGQPCPDGLISQIQAES